MATNIFEQATKLKLRFNTAMGNVTTEDLWDLPLTSVKGISLDDTAKLVAGEIRKAEEESFVNKTSGSPINELRLKILKHIIADKIAANKAKDDEQIKATRKAKLEAALERKQDNDLADMSPEEIEAELKKL